jgi:hypothetical protein
MHSALSAAKRPLFPVCFQSFSRFVSSYSVRAQTGLKNSLQT